MGAGEGEESGMGKEKSSDMQMEVGSKGRSQDQMWCPGGGAQFRRSQGGKGRLPPGPWDPHAAHCFLWP